MDENYSVQELDMQDTIPEQSSSEKDIGNCAENLVTPNNDVRQSEDIARDTVLSDVQEPVSENNVKSEPFVSVQYNHKNRDFTKEEAIKFIQKGMHTENLRAKLEYLAEKQGTDVNSIVERIVTEPELAHRKYLEQLYGEGSRDVEIGMEIYREKQSKEYRQLMSASENEKRKQKEIENVNSRLADEYMTLKNEIPDAPEYSKLPDSVIIEAAKGEMSLYSAYLHYLYKEKLKIDAAEKAQMAAGIASTGKMGIDSGENMTSNERNFLSGLWGR